MNKMTAIGIDFGATKISTVVMDNDGNIYNSSTISTRPNDNINIIFDRFANEINNLTREYHSNLCGIGIGIPGILNYEEGIVLNSVNLKWKNVRFVEEIRSRLTTDVPIKLLGDTLASAQGEYYFGAAQKCENYIYIAIGTGIGGGIVLQGKVLKGVSGLSCAIGHYVLVPEGDECSCGLRGCPELLLSGGGIINLTRKYIDERKITSVLTNLKDLSTEDIIFAAENNDELALVVISEFGRLLGKVLVNCIVVINPGMIVISGGLGNAIFDIIRPYIEMELSTHLLNQFTDNLKIVRSGLENSAIGAACMILFG